MHNPLKVLVRQYSWVHLGIGLVGNIAFFVGSIFFLPRFEHIQVWGTWLFIVGAFLMAVGSVGRLLLSIWKEPSDDRSGE
ncbi:MAG: YrhK family protein [Opitutales bacterium]